MLHGQSTLMKYCTVFVCNRSSSSSVNEASQVDIPLHVYHVTPLCPMPFSCRLVDVIYFSFDRHCLIHLMLTITQLYFVVIDCARERGSAYLTNAQWITGHQCFSHKWKGTGTPIEALTGWGLGRGYKFYFFLAMVHSGHLF